MNSLRLIIYLAFSIQECTFTSVFQLTTSQNPATAGESLSFVCTTNENFIAFSKNGNNYCTITNNDNTCSLDFTSCPSTSTSSCSNGNNTMTLPGSLVNSNIHGSKWKCASPFGIGTPSTEVVLIVNIPLQEVTLTPNGTITTIEGQSLTFRCFAKSRPLASLSWQLNGSVLPTPSPPVTSTDTVTSTYTYIANRDDNGKRLSCTAVYESTSFTEVALINVLYRPSVTISPNYSEYKVIENTTNFELSCTVTVANPPVTSYKWYKDGAVLVGSTDVLHTLSTVRSSNTGSYRCDASNEVGTSDRSPAVELEVLFGAVINNIDKKEPKEGGQLLIMCSVQSNPPVTDNDVTWTKQNNNTFSMKKKQLEISNVNRLDSGTYVCSVVIKLTPTVGLPIGVTGRTTAEVDVLHRPSVTISPNYSEYKVIENTTNFEFSCTVTAAKPTVTSYNWYKDGIVIDGSTDVLHTISTVQRSYTGSYRCDATNEVGTSDKSSAVQLHVLFGAEIHNIDKKEPKEGEQLLIMCSVQSSPPVTDNDVTWTKENNNTFNMKQQILEISNVNRLDSGIYLCTAVIKLTPTVGQPIDVTGRTTVEVDVLYRPDVTISPVRNPYTVTENTTTFHLTCNVTNANPAVTSHRWYKDGVKVSTAATYIIPKVYRYHSGSYICYASNTVGISDPSYVLQLNVLYGVSLILLKSEIDIDESDRWDFSCIGDGNPLPNVACVYGYNGTIVGEQKHNATSISVNHANCIDTGYYMCSGNNTIGEPVSQSAEIKVACKPRTYNNLDREDILMRATDESINISTTFISFPLSHISWSRELSDGQLADLDSNFKYFSIPSHLPYETIAILQKDQLKPNEFGIYLVNASNIYGSFIMKYRFIQKKDPIPPSYVYVVCKSTTAIVILMKPIANENLPQDLYIQYDVEGKDMISIKVLTIVANQPNEYTVTGLNPGGKYNFSILAVNPYGETRSNQFGCLTETLSYSEDMLAVKQGNGGMFSAGIASLVVGLLFFVAATIFIFRKRFKKTYTKSPKSDEYSDLQTSNPAFQDPYTTLQNPIESRHRQETSANTYEECGNTSGAATYQHMENMNYGHKKDEKNMGIYDNMKI